MSRNIGWFIVVLIALVILVLACFHTKPAAAADLSGSVGVTYPVAGDPSYLNDRTPILNYDLKLCFPQSPISLVSSGNYVTGNFGGNYPWENKISLGAEYAIGKRGCFFLLGERRWTLDENRLLAGFRMNFKSK